MKNIELYRLVLCMEVIIGYLDIPVFLNLGMLAAEIKIVSNVCDDNML